MLQLCNRLGMGEFKLSRGEDNAPFWLEQAHGQCPRSSAISELLALSYEAVGQFVAAHRIIKIYDAIATTDGVAATSSMTSALRSRISLFNRLRIECRIDTTAESTRLSNSNDAALLPEASITALLGAAIVRLVTATAPAANMVHDLLLRQDHSMIEEEEVIERRLACARVHLYFGEPRGASEDLKHIGVYDNGSSVYMSVYELLLHVSLTTSSVICRDSQSPLACELKLATQAILNESGLGDAPYLPRVASFQNRATRHRAHVLCSFVEVANKNLCQAKRALCRAIRCSPDHVSNGCNGWQRLEQFILHFEPSQSDFILNRSCSATAPELMCESQASQYLGNPDRMLRCAARAIFLSPTMRPAYRLLAQACHIQAQRRSSRRDLDAGAFYSNSAGLAAYAQYQDAGSKLMCSDDSMASETSIAMRLFERHSHALGKVHEGHEIILETPTLSAGITTRSVSAADITGLQACFLDVLNSPSITNAVAQICIRGNNKVLAGSCSSRSTTASAAREAAAKLQEARLLLFSKSFGACMKLATEANVLLPSHHLPLLLCGIVSRLGRRWKKARGFLERCLLNLQLETADLGGAAGDQPTHRIARIVAFLNLGLLDIQAKEAEMARQRWATLDAESLAIANQMPAVHAHIQALNII